MKKNCSTNKKSGFYTYWLNLFNIILGLTLVPTICQAAISFTNVTSFDTEARAQALLVEDFNNDNNLDLVVSYHYSNYRGSDYLSLLHGNGDGTFQAATDYPAAYLTNRLIAGDFNNDNALDVVASHNSTLEMYAGNGTGFMPYTTAANLIVGGGLYDTADFDKDGNLDIVKTNYIMDGVTNKVSLYMGKGNGTFQVNSSITELKPNPTTVHAADFNGDGNADVAVSYPWGNKIAINFGNGDGTFGATTFYVFTPWGLHNNNFSVEDINFDGFPDIVGMPDHIANYRADTLINNGFGLFTTVSWTNMSSMAPHAMATADFNCDGKHDMALSSRDSTDSLYKLAIYSGNGDGTFQYDSSYPLEGIEFPPLSGTTLIDAKDLNGDGKTDIVIKSAMQQSVNIYLNTTSPETGYCSANPDIKANGSNGPLVINQGDMLDLTVSLDPGFTAGVDSDSWIYGISKTIGTYWYQPGTGWTASGTPIPAYQGPLAAVTDRNVLSTSTLPAGEYDFYFQIDERNGLKEGARTDAVHVTIQ